MLRQQILEVIQLVLFVSSYCILTKEIGLGMIDGGGQFGQINTIPSDEVLELLEQTVMAHNEIRQRHGSPPLMINPELVDLAQLEAQKYSETGDITHVRFKYRNESVGQNFALSQRIALKGRYQMFSTFFYSINLNYSAEINQRVKKFK